ncbi:hypothetical protein [Albibacterium sp.]|uniref:hypothetical protein n=1 Tax=Albibacterium sp. TaxID=2952885 RepID=UPI002BE53A9F|nr:hypothetical protein [Albibacterium sp.]HUH17952.1 hypothetical protein [Albibacterium sp.]
MRVQTIKDSEVSEKKKIAIAASLTAVVVILVIAYKKFQPKLLKFLGTKKYHSNKRNRAFNDEVDYNEYIEMMLERQENYENQASLWI